MLLSRSTDVRVSCLIKIIRAASAGVIKADHVGSLAWGKLCSSKLLALRMIRHPAPAAGSEGSRSRATLYSSRAASPLCATSISQLPSHANAAACAWPSSRAASPNWCRACGAVRLQMGMMCHMGMMCQQATYILIDYLQHVVISAGARHTVKAHCQQKAWKAAWHGQPAPKSQAQASRQFATARGAAHLLGVGLGLAPARPQHAAQLEVVLADLPVRHAAPRARRHLQRLF